MSAGRKKYALAYRIYRRMRYLRYVKKLRKRQKQKILHADKSAQKERNRIIKNQRKADRISDRQKIIQERTEIRDARIKLKEEFGQNADEYQAAVAERKAFEAKERKFRRYRRKRLIKFYSKVCIKSTIRTLKTFNPENLPILIRYIKQNRKNTRDFVIIAIHSTFLFTAAYFMIFLIGLLISSVS